MSNPYGLTDEQMQAYAVQIAEEKQARQSQALLRKIADGKLLMRFSYMTHNVTCDCCRSEEKIEYHAQPDCLRHKDWCLVKAARNILPDFSISNYPENLHQLRGWGQEGCDKPEFAWIESREE
jgi:hypothetical protein